MSRPPRPAPHFPVATTRREFLQQAGGGFGALALAWLLHQERGPRRGRARGPARPQAAPLPGQGASGSSSCSCTAGRATWRRSTPSPTSSASPASRCPRASARSPPAARSPHNPLLATKRTFRKYGAERDRGLRLPPPHRPLRRRPGGHPVVLGRQRQPPAGRLPDEHRLDPDGQAEPGELGRATASGPRTRTCPPFVVLPDPGRRDQGRPARLRRGVPAGELPGDASIRGGDEPDPRPPARPSATSRREQRGMLDLVGRLNAHHLESRGDDAELSARIQSYELAYRMQTRRARGGRPRRASRPRRRRLYGLDDRDDRPSSAPAACWPGGWSSGASGSSSSTRATSTAGTPTTTSRRTTPPMCGRTDRPVAGLLTDLKRRGPVRRAPWSIWGGEFGRMPMSESGKGRDHNPHGFSFWLAGAGIKGGTVHGATDAVGLRAEVDRVHVHDLHATILHLLGPRPHPAHLPPQRPRRAPDRHRRPGRPGDPRLSRPGPTEKMTSACDDSACSSSCSCSSSLVRRGLRGAGRREADHGRGPRPLGLRPAGAARGPRGQGSGLGPQPDRRLRPRRRSRRTGWARPRGRPGDAPPPAELRPDGPAADARGGRRLPRRSARRTPTSGSSTGCWRARTTASAGRSTGSTWPGTPTPTGSSSTRPGPTPGGIATGSSRP